MGDCGREVRRSRTAALLVFLAAAARARIVAANIFEWLDNRLRLGVSKFLLLCPLFKARLVLFEFIREAVPSRKFVNDVAKWCVLFVVESRHAGLIDAALQVFFKITETEALRIN